MQTEQQQYSCWLWQLSINKAQELKIYTNIKYINQIYAR